MISTSSISRSPRSNTSRGIQERFGNSRDYAEEIIARMCAYFSPRQIRQLAQERQMFVAMENETVVGTVSRDGNKVFTMFVQPRMIGRGVGRRLIQHIEALAAHILRKPLRASVL